MTFIKRYDPTRTVLAMAAGLALLGACLGLACSREGRHRVLTFLFDDVPPLDGATTQSATSQPGAAQRGSPGRGQTGPAGATTQPGRRAGRGSSHGPFKKGRCAACHNMDAGMRVTMDSGTLCRKCHHTLVRPLKFVHAPVVTFQCQFCHHAHSSPLPHLLKMPDGPLCLECHDRSRILTTPYHGPEAAIGCARCHDPHGGDNPVFLTKRPLAPGTQKTPSSQPRKQGED